MSIFGERLFGETLKELQDENLIPILSIQPYLAKQNFMKPYTNAKEFSYVLLDVLYTPIQGLANAVYYMFRGVWAVLKSIVNLLIVHPADSLEAIKGAGEHFRLSLALALMAPVNVVLGSLKFMSRLIATWVHPAPDSGPEGGNGKRFIDLFTQKAEEYAKTSKLPVNQKAEEVAKTSLLPNASFFDKSRFFKPYSEAQEVLKTARMIVALPIRNLIESVLMAYEGILNILSCLAHLIIFQPKQALKDLSDTGVYFSLSLCLALMVPTQVIVNTVELLTRLGSTWFSAAFRTDPPAERNDTAYVREQRVGHFSKLTTVRLETDGVEEPAAIAGAGL